MGGIMWKNYVCSYNCDMTEKRDYEQELKKAKIERMRAEANLYNKIAEEIIAEANAIENNSAEY
jgi:hypothetical protein